MKLNLGCGQRSLPGYINADIRTGNGVDCMFDAQETWPFRVASLEKVYASAVFEHLLRWENALMEAARVLKSGGVLEILVPYGWRGFSWPFHLRCFIATTFDLFIEPFRYRGVDFRLHNSEIGTCERERYGYFSKLAVYRLHYFPFSWHLAKRIGDWVYRIPLCRTHNLHIILQRNEIEWKEPAK